MKLRGLKLADEIIWSPSVRRAWIETAVLPHAVTLCHVALRAEGVD